MAACGAGTSADCDKVTENIRLRLKLVMQQVCDWGGGMHMLEFETCNMWYIHILRYYYQLQDVGEKEVSVFTALKMLCTTLFTNPNISVGNEPLIHYFLLGLGPREVNLPHPYQ